MSNTVGVTLGKFMPLHRGHELMIEFGASMLDFLYVIVSGKETDEIPLNLRFQWVCDKYLRFENIKVICHEDYSPKPRKIDIHGTVLDDDFQEYWKSEILRLVPNVTHFVTSDLYGEIVSKNLGIKWLPVDPMRETIMISATEIRKRPFDNFHLISDVAKPYFSKKAKRIVLVGPESCGKTTMAKDLASIYKTTAVYEYGRTISELTRNKLNVEDFYTIMYGQEALIEIAHKKARAPVIFADTEAFTTYLFGEIYLNESIEFIHERAKKQQFDLYILLAPSVNWIDDGLRVMPEQHTRDMFFSRFVEFLEENKKPYIVVRSKSFSERYKTVIEAIEKVIKED